MGQYEEIQYHNTYKEPIYEKKSNLFSIDLLIFM